MADRRLHCVIEHTRRLVAAEAAEGLADRALLERFVRGRDEAAFTAIVHRHAAMVLAVCRRVLRHGQDAEDASQATFLVLARSAASIRKRTALGCWLHGVAYRIARKLRTAQERRRVREQRAGLRRCEPVRDARWSEVLAALDEALMALPEKYRAPLVLCYLEERTRDEAAAQLGLPLSTLRGRLDQGRDLLRSQLMQHGITLSSALLLAALSESSGTAAAPAFVTGTVHAAMGRSAATAAVRLLADGAAKTIGTSKAILAAVVCVIVSLGIAAGAGVLGRPRDAGEAERANREHTGTCRGRSTAAGRSPRAT